MDQVDMVRKLVHRMEYLAARNGFAPFASILLASGGLLESVGVLVHHLQLVLVILIVFHIDDLF